MMKQLFFSFAMLFWFSCLAQNYVPDYANDKIKVKPVVPLKAYAFDIKEVRITGGVFKKAMELDAAYLLEIQPDRLLHRFYQNAGLPVKGPVYGGWESETISGHTLGHYLSAVSMMYASTGDSRFKERADYITKELERCQHARKTGYIGGVPNEDTVFAQVARGDIRSQGFDLNGAWVPWYTLHKVMSGLIDAYLYCNNDQAMQVLIRISDWIDHELKGLNDTQIQKMLNCEFGGMNDALVNMYAITGKKKYLELSYKFHHKAIIDSLAHQKDIMVGKHSNTNIPKVIGTARRYELTGSKQDSTAADFFWHTIVYHHSYVNGGNSNYEYLGAEDRLNDRLSDNTTETCNTYNMLKLTRQLFTVHPKAEYANFYERALYNHILATQEKDSGMFCYFVPLRMGGQKTYSDKFNSFWCCVGTGIENHAKYGEGIYYRSGDGGLYVNLFIPSVLNWREKGATITQTTLFPEANNTYLKIGLKKPQHYPVYFKDAWWSKGKILIKINGQQIQPMRNADGYWVVERTWKNNDAIEVITDMHLYTESMPDNEKRVALFYGPLLLAGDLGTKTPDPVTGVPVLLTADKEIDHWVKPVRNQPLRFKMEHAGKPFDAELFPFYEMHHRYYSVYWDRFTPAEYSDRETEYKAEKLRQQAIEARTIDVLRLGEMQPERDHQLTASDNSYVSDAMGRTGREARAGGFFAFDLKVDPHTKNRLLFTYIGDDKNSEFDITVDDKKGEHVKWAGGQTGRFYDEEYPLPAELTKGKTRVRIKVAANSGRTAGRIFNARILKDPGNQQ